MERTDIRLALPSKGILQDGAIEFLEACGLKVFRPNPRQYAATIPALPGVTVMFQRPGDIVTSVQQGSIEFGVTGYDVLAERGANSDSAVLIIHEALGFGPCALKLAAPEAASPRAVADLPGWAAELAAAGRPLRVATKFPRLTAAFLDGHGVAPYQLVAVEGTLEIAPAIGYADLICDLVSSASPCATTTCDRWRAASSCAQRRYSSPIAPRYAVARKRWPPPATCWNTSRPTCGRKAPT